MLITVVTAVKTSLMKTSSKDTHVHAHTATDRQAEVYMHTYIRYNVNAKGMFELPASSCSSIARQFMTFATD